MSITRQLSKSATWANRKVLTEMYVESWHHSLVLAMKQYQRCPWSGLLSVGREADYTHEISEDGSQIMTYKVSLNGLSKRLFATTQTASPFKYETYSKNTGEVIADGVLTPGQYGIVLAA